ncbi:regulator of G-protein signaling 22 [Aplochiton taeniatus]
MFSFQKSCLAFDGILVHFFNKFLSLPSFPDHLQYNQLTGVFEVVSDAADCVSQRIRAALLQGKSKPSTNDLSQLARRPVVENWYTVCCLDKEQGMHWIIDKRLPLFIKSDWYFEYRLCKLLSPKYHNQTIKSSSEACLCSSQVEETDGKDKGRDYVCLSQMSYSSDSEFSSRLLDEEKDQGLGSSDPDVGFHGTCCHGIAQGLDEFKEFLQGTPGEKLLHLWIDVERLKSLKDSERKNRHLVQMRSRYVLSGGQSSSLSVELLSRLGLSTTPCWREEKLRLIQPHLTGTLAGYWFWSARSFQFEQPLLRLGTRSYLRPSSGIDPYPSYITLHPLRPHTCLPRQPKLVKSQPGNIRTLSSSISPVLGGLRMERMVQALLVDSQAGLYLTGFCESSGNQLWKNAVHFWSDLQQYHQLFCQDGLDPYRVQRHAQLLYSTYLCSAARRSIGVDEESRREVYHCLMPAFEELFDGVEEHTLLLLLDPWIELTTRDRDSYLRVCVREEVRQVDSAEYLELQILYEEAALRLQQQAEECCPSPPTTPEGPREPDAWSYVPVQYRGYRLGSLLRQRNEIQHFLSFLQDNDASIHLSCWLDLDQYKRTPPKDKVLKEERSASIKNTYLNRKYLFGPASPASTEQQEEILRLAGGWERLQHNRVSAHVVGEVQNIVRSHIEKTWLPLFLATPEFTDRQKHKTQAGDRRSNQAHLRSRKRREAWKQAEGMWMSSSKEILVFRRVLLNPVTCQQFQHFVALKGDYLENDVLFWLEVQRYKDLCHSHCAQSTVQQKVSTIISCFINSSIPPALRLDIPREQADTILHQRKELGPYVFREAQMSVFSELLKLWPQFQAFRSTVRDEEVLPLLEHKRLKHRAKAQRRNTTEEEEDGEEEEKTPQG